MKTNIKRFMIFMSCFIFGISHSYTNWYGDYAYHISWNGGWCIQDSSLDVVGPSPQLYGPNYGNDGWSRYYIQARVNGWWNGYNDGWMRCQYWDSTPPTISSITYIPTTTNGWTNNPNFPVTIAGNDQGGSGIQRYYLYYRYQDNPGSTSPGPWSGWIYCGNVANSFNFTCDTTRGTSNRAYQLSAGIQDVAGNLIATNLDGGIIYVDTTLPSPTNLIGPTQTNYLANDSESFSFNFNDGGAPVAIMSQIEDYDNSNGWIPAFDDPYAFAYAHTKNQNISKVDGPDRGVNGGRQYTYRITQICDQVRNCATTGLPRTFNYNVYANPTTTVSNTSGTAGTSIADGTANTLTHTIRDQFGNAIIPATGISRTITQNLSDISNTMYLDQFTRSGPTSVYVDSNTTPLTTSSTQVIGVRSSSDGSYPLNLYVYTPTATAYTPTEPVSDPSATFGFTSNLVVSDTLIGAPRTFSQALPTPVFRPLYTTSITGDMKAGGFIEGTIQSGSITIQNNNSGVSPTSLVVRGSFSGSDASSFDFYIAPPGTWLNSPAIATIQSSVNNIPLFQSRLLQKPEFTVSNLSNLQFSTHFSYTLNSKNIIYNSDIIGKPSYHSSSSSNIGSQYGVHIIGSIASSVARELTAGQFASSASIFGGINRATIRNNMSKAIALATRNITMTSVGTNISSLSALPGGSGRQGGIIDLGNDTSIMKLQSDGGSFVLNNGSISGKRTLVIEGADFYINTDMYYSDVNSILGIVVKKNANGSGGNLYINPNITNIVGSYVIDGSVMTSTDGMNPTGIGNIETLKNQLHIYGSIVSENTIGGSKNTPAKCPSLLNITSCTIDEAQKYDLNYLRRYYLYANQPFGNARIIGGGTCNSGGVCTGANPNLKQKFNMTSSDLAKYPVIIEQNPVIRTSPPPGFDATMD